VKDYYEILELEFGAEILAVKKAYRQLALKYHPDKNKEPNASQKFIEITEAYEVLRDPLKKSEYDRLYQAYFRTKSKEEYTEQSYERTYQRKQKEWADFGREKAKEYSSIPFEEFAKRLLKEISVGASYNGPLQFESPSR
jgi:DnaJ-class molecular chaperone